MTRNLKLVFYVEDWDTKEILVEKSQQRIELNDHAIADASLVPGLEARLGAASKANMEWLHLFTDIENRKKPLKEMFEAAGIVIGRFLFLKVLALLVKQKEPA
jgi:hypothetical protein